MFSDTCRHGHFNHPEAPKSCAESPVELIGCGRVFFRTAFLSQSGFLFRCYSASEAAVLGLVLSLVTALREASPGLTAEEAGECIGNAVQLAWDEQGS
ncbi:hypothetical protein ACHMW5_35935 (plasmid) [Azospirillum melinis]|uniref:hypothetical protein n=1 Tax=Azospirillum melinis TaxID=328839 RepID=UPI0037570C3D